MAKNNFNLKIVIVGDGAVGKTSLLSTYTSGIFPTDYVPTVFENKTSTIDLGQGNTVDVSLWDTAGQEDFDRIRALFYPDSDAFIVCFSAVDVNSAYNVKERWFPELQLYAAQTPFVLVSTKTDLRTNEKVLQQLRTQGTSPVSTEQGQLLANDVKASGYFETSAAQMKGVQEPFRAAAKLALDKRRGGKALPKPPPKAAGGGAAASSKSTSPNQPAASPSPNSSSSKSESCCVLL